MFLLLSFKVDIEDYGVTTDIPVKDLRPFEHGVTDHGIGVPEVDQHGGD